MTTVATDGRTMAGDSLTNAGGIVTRLAPKVHRLPDGRIFGCSGVTVDCLKFEAYLRDGGEQPKVGDEWSALVLNTDGTVDYYDEGFIPVRYLLPAAIGSGREIALGAMYAGATPTQAVEIAAKVDTCTGGPITSETREYQPGEARPYIVAAYV